MDTPMQEIFIGRQPILDRDQRMFAYELLFRCGRQNFAWVSDDRMATATVLSHAITELGLESALGPYLGFINLDARMLMSDVLEMLPRDKFVLEVLETVELTPQVIARCRALKDMGFTLALDDFVTLEDQHRPLLELVDVVKVELMGMSDANLASTVKALRRWPVKLLAEKVDNEAQMKHCLELGFELFQGYYFAKPTIIAGKKLAFRDDAEPPARPGAGGRRHRRTGGHLRPEPGLTLNLMRLTNSAASGVRQKITSVRHAITVLGRRQLQRWLQLLVYADASPNGPLASPLMQLAATRGRFMELLAGDLMGSGPRSRGPRLHDRHHVLDAGPAARADRRGDAGPECRERCARGAGNAARRPGRDAAAGRKAGRRRPGCLLRPHRRAARARHGTRSTLPGPGDGLGEQPQPIAFRISGFAVSGRLTFPASTKSRAA
ncbi:MAG: EAL domain-containing protein [Rhodocyclaceae bacterium]|nr:EAL domain-containing protein [Rhodocyclaceae bacterium]